MLRLKPVLDLVDVGVEVADNGSHVAFAALG